MIREPAVAVQYDSTQKVGWWGDPGVYCTVLNDNVLRGPHPIQRTTERLKIRANLQSNLIFTFKA
jgi:hypothetical protein